MKPQEFSQPRTGQPGGSGIERARVIVVGTGFSGLCMGVKLREMGEHINTRLRVAVLP